MEKSADVVNLAEADWVLAIDPGADGGLARIWGTGELEVWRMPTEAQGGKQRLVHLIFEEIFSDHGCRVVVIENVWGREGDGKRQITTFMKHVGFLEGLVTAALRDLTEDAHAGNPNIVWVPATKWQKALGCPKAPTKSEQPERHKRKTIHKNNLKQFASDLFPNTKFTLCTADAALIAEWGRRSAL